MPASTPAVKLTRFSHGGGCGCKIAPALLQEILKDLPFRQHFPDLLVGIESADDAAVYRLNDTQAVVATTDFFMPIVDDPYDFGCIAATNALSDIYAMGGQPIFALAIVGMPVDKLPADVIRQILAGGEAVCQAAGIPIAGGHSIDAPEPIYGLVGIGLVHPDHVKRNNTGRAGDTLILGKPLGVGILSAALKKEKLDAARYTAMIVATTRLNTPGTAIARIADVHAMTDVTGFGLLGHTLEIARGSNLTARIDSAKLPVIDGVRELAEAGYFTGAGGRNWAGYGEYIDLAPNIGNWQQALLTDPQTSGGLLVSCGPDSVDEVLELFWGNGFDDARVIGGLVPGPGRVSVT